MVDSKPRVLAGAILFVSGALGFLGGGWVTGAGSRYPLQSVEFPLGDVQDIAVDREGNILVALGFYGRIQLYDSEGRFKRGWPADAGGGSFTVAFRNADVVASYANRRRSTFLFDLTGKRLAETSEPSPPDHRGAPSIRTPDGSTLRLRNRLLWPAVVREKDGVTSTVVAGPWYLRPVTGPVPACFLVLAGILLIKRPPARMRERHRSAEAVAEAELILKSRTR